MFADRTGRFRAAGITVDIQQQSSGAAIAAGIVGGAYDVGKSSLTSVLNAHLKNIPFTVIAPGGLSDQRVPYGHLIVANDSGITSAKDLNGKTLSVASLSSLDPVTISSWIDANGGDAKTVKFVEIPQTESGAAVVAHRIAAALTEEFDLRPDAIIELLDLKRPIYYPTAAYGHFGRAEFAWEAVSNQTAGIPHA